MESNKEIDLESFITRLRTEISRDGGNQSSFARKKGISRNYLNNVLRGERVPGRGLCQALGFERVYRFVEREDDGTKEAKRR